MNISAKEASEKAEIELRTALKELEEVAEKDLIQQSQEARESYAKATAVLVASNVQGGSMYPSVYWSEMAEMIDDRIHELRAVKNNWMM